MISYGAPQEMLDEQDDFNSSCKNTTKCYCGHTTMCDCVDMLELGQIPEKKPAPNVIDKWLQEHGNPEIAKQVEEEASKLFEHEVKVLSKEEIVGRKERYSERFNNDSSAIGNPETWGKRTVYSKEQVITILESFVEHPTKPGYKRKDILNFIKEFKNK